MKYSNVLILISLIITVIISIALINLFPKTGLSRIVFIPLLLGINLVLTFGINKILKRHSKKFLTYGYILLQFGFFHLCLWIWPQSSANHKNLITEFYSLII
jgi:hypothetical protein